MFIRTFFYKNNPFAGRKTEEPIRKSVRNIPRTSKQKKAPKQKSRVLRNLNQFSTLYSMYALIIWVNDDPVMGSVVKMTAIVEPRLPLQEYRVGQEVKARCQGYGTCVGVIGKIADEVGRKDLCMVLGDERFKDIVENVMKERLAQDTQGTVSACTPAHSTVSQTEQPNQIQKEKTSKKPDPQRKKRKNEVKETGQAAKNTQLQLERAANELELTEVEQMVAGSKPCTTYNVESVPDASKTFASDVALPSSSVTELSKKSDDRTECLESTLRQSLEVLHGPQEKAPTYQDPVRPEPVYSLPTPTTTQNSGYYDQQLHTLRQELFQANSRIANLEANYTWLWNYVQQMHCNISESAVQTQTSASQQMSSSTMHVDQGNANNFMHSESDENSAAPSCAEELIGGFTMEQLDSKVMGIESFSKMAIMLFRVLFKEEEYIGKSLTGAPSKTGERKECVDQKRLQGIYKVVGKHFPHVTPVMVREKLRDILKPSRANRKPKN